MLVDPLKILEQNEILKVISLNFRGHAIEAVREGVGLYSIGHFNLDQMLEDVVSFADQSGSWVRYPEVEPEPESNCYGVCDDLSREELTPAKARETWIKTAEHFGYDTKNLMW